MKRFHTPAERRELRRKGDANRLASIGLRISDALGREFNANIGVGATTSNAPLIRIEFPDGSVYHCTVTKARK